MMKALNFVGEYKNKVFFIDVMQFFAGTPPSASFEQNIVAGIKLACMCRDFGMQRRFAFYLHQVRAIDDSLKS